MRLQLARAQSALLTPEEYDQFFTVHGMTMIFWNAAPILSTYFIPLLIRARDMALPRQRLQLLVIPAFPASVKPGQMFFSVAYTPGSALWWLKCSP